MTTNQPDCSAVQVSSADVVTPVAKAYIDSLHRSGLTHNNWANLPSAQRSEIRLGMQAVVEFLTSVGRLVPVGGIALMPEQWAHYQRMAADPRFAELSRDALGVMKWPENPLLPPALFPAAEPAEPVVPNPEHPYFVWEQGYQAAVTDSDAGVDGTRGNAYTNNPYSLGESEPDPATEPAEVISNIFAEGNSSPTVVHVHHHDIEAHAASFNDGFDEAVRQLAEPAQATINSTLSVHAPAEPAEEETKAERKRPELWYVEAQDRPNAGNSSAYIDSENRANYYAKLFLDSGYLTVTIHPPVVAVPTEASVIGGAAVALRAALAVVDPHEAGPWEHAWLSVRDLEDCASRAEAIALTETEWPSLDAVPAHVRTVRDKVGDEYRRVENGGWDFRSSEWQTIISPTADYDEFAPFVAVEEQDR